MCLSEVSVFASCSTFRWLLCPSGFVTVAVSSHSSCSERIANRAICSSNRSAKPSVMACSDRSWRTDRKRSHRNLLLTMNGTSGRSSSRPYRYEAVIASASRVRTMSGVTLSTMRVYFFTASVSSEELRSFGSRRSNSSMSFLRMRNSRSEGGHISTHVPMMCVPPPRFSPSTTTSARSSSSSSSSSSTTASSFSSGPFPRDSHRPGSAGAYPDVGPSCHLRRTHRAALTRPARRPRASRSPSPRGPCRRPSRPGLNAFQGIRAKSARRRAT